MIHVSVNRGSATAKSESSPLVHSAKPATITANKIVRTTAATPVLQIPGVMSGILQFVATDYTDYAHRRAKGRSEKICGTLGVSTFFPVNTLIQWRGAWAGSFRAVS